MKHIKIYTLLHDCRIVCAIGKGETKTLRKNQTLLQIQAHSIDNKTALAYISTY